MSFTSTQVKGAGIGSAIGYPTINLKIPKKFDLKQGVYSCTITISQNILIGILYFGPKSIEYPVKPVEKLWKTLEAHIINKQNLNKICILPFKPKQKISLRIEQFLRPPKKIISLNQLKQQIKQDINNLTQEASGKIVEKKKKILNKGFT